MESDHLVIRGQDGGELGPTMSVSTAGEVLGISRGAAYRGAASGDIPTIKIGRRLLVPTAALRRMLEGEPREAA